MRRSGTDRIRRSFAAAWIVGGAPGAVGGGAMLAVSMATGGINLIVTAVLVAQVAAVMLAVALVVFLLVWAIRRLILWSRRP
ncbi:MAG TPA: hypothetical protein VK157_16095 [Phycisphaerales bacterium]|nr:hypothetical protein [Phycisphaerales bacterium]